MAGMTIPLQAQITPMQQPQQQAMQPRAVSGAGVGTWAQSNPQGGSSTAVPTQSNSQNATYNPSTPAGNLLTGAAGPTTGFWSSAQQAGNQFQNIGTQGQSLMTQGQGLLDSSLSGNLTGPQQEQLNTQLTTINQNKQTAIAQIQSSFSSRGISDPAIQSDAIDIANSVYSQQAMSAYNTIIQQGEQLGMSEMGMGEQMEGAGAAGEAGIMQTMLSDIGGTRQQTSSSSASFMDLVGGLLGGAADIGGAYIGGLAKEGEL
jgi:hypothetical protein